MLQQERPGVTNKYLPGSEVEFRITIIPDADIKYDRFQIKVDLNSLKNQKIQIKNNVWSWKTGAASASEDILEGEIMNPPNQKFDVYFSYRIAKVTPKDKLGSVEKTITNQALVIPIRQDGSVGKILKAS